MPSPTRGGMATLRGDEVQMDPRLARSTSASTGASDGARPSNRRLRGLLSLLPTDAATSPGPPGPRTYMPHPFLPPAPVPSRFLPPRSDLGPPSVFASGSTGNRYDHAASLGRCTCVHPNAISPAGGTSFLDLESADPPSPVDTDPKGKGKAKAKSTLSTTLLGPALIHLNPRVPRRNRFDPYVTNAADEDGWAYEAAPSEGKATDPEVHGIVSLYLSKPRRVRRVIVSLVVMANLAFSEWTYEAKELDRRDVVLDLDSKLLDRGDHSFSFCIIIPSSTAPSISSSYGRVYHRIHTRLEYASPSTAPAADSDDSDAEPDVEGRVPMPRRTSRPRLPMVGVKAPLVGPEVELELLVAPDEHQLELDTVLDTSSDSYSEELGPYSVSLHSNLLSVSGLLSCSVNLECPLNAIRLHRISAKIIEDTTLYSVEALKCKVAEGRLDAPDPDGPGVQKVPLKERAIFTVQGDPRPSSVRRPSAPHVEQPKSPVERTRLSTSVPSSPRDVPRSATVESNASFSPSVSSSRRTSLDSEDSDSTVASSRPFSSPGTSPSSMRSRFLSFGRGGGRLPSLGGGGGGEPGEERPVLAALKIGQEWEMTHVARLPMCHLLRPSSHGGSATPFRMKHQIAVDIVYTVVPSSPDAPLPPPRLLRISKNVHVHGCRCLFSNLILPPYEKQGCDASAQGRCACRFTTDELVASEKQSLAYRSAVGAAPFIQPPSMVNDGERDVKTGGFGAIYEQFEV